MTETVKHTPGPWEVFTVKDEPQLLNFHSAIYGPQGDYDGLFVALANQNGRYEADALMIAAAPELLEALKLFVRAEKMARDGNPPTGADELIELGDAAIAKAEGRS